MTVRPTVKPAMRSATPKMSKKTQKGVVSKCKQKSAVCLQLSNSSRSRQTCFSSKKYWILIIIPVFQEFVLSTYIQGGKFVKFNIIRSPVGLFTTIVKTKQKK